MTLAFVRRSLCLLLPLLMPLSSRGEGPPVPDWAQPGSATHAQVAPPSDFHRKSTILPGAIGAFEGQADVGSAVVPGAASFDAATGKYLVSSAGYNIWYGRDEFRFLWRKVSGDVSLAATMSFPDAGGYGDRKAVLIIRKSLDDDSPEVLAGVHGTGSVQLARRPEAGAEIVDMEYAIGSRGDLPGEKLPNGLVPAKPPRLGLEKKGDDFQLLVSVAGEALHPFGPPMHLHIEGPFYAGIGFCSHLPDKVDRAEFSDVVLQGRPAITAVSHIAFLAADPAASERFYVHDLGAAKGEDAENPKGVRYYFSPRQFVEILPLPAGGKSAPGRLDHVAFTVSDVRAMRDYLAAHQWKVPASVSDRFTVEDPEGRHIEFVQLPDKLPAVPDNPLSAHIIHAGFIIQDRAKEDSFYRGLLGFRPYWYGGMKDDQASWISQQLPDGPDWLEYMVVAPGDKVDRRLAGILDHLALGVANVETAYTALWAGDRLSGQQEQPKIGRDAKWQLNLYDPDGTRAELMELHAIGTPCCSPFTAADPEK